MGPLEIIILVAAVCLVAGVVVSQIVKKYRAKKSGISACGGCCDCCSSCPSKRGVKDD